MTSVLWIVQDGILSGPGASQTVPYLLGLRSSGFDMSLLSFEKERFLTDRRRVSVAANELWRGGVRWVALPFGRGAAAPRTAVQLLRAAGAGRGLAARERVDIVHGRSYLAALMGLAFRRPLVFDMRGVWPEERIDGGLWRRTDWAYRGARRLERLLLRSAAAVVVLARAARSLLPPLDVPVRVIPTAVDVRRFRPGLPPPPGAEGLVGRRVFVLAGALGSWYLLSSALDLLARAVARRSDGHVLVLTEEDPTPAVSGLLSRGVPRSRLTVEGVPHRDVPRWFSLASAGLLLVRSAPSKRASMPTKLGEFLASGVPVLTTPGIGDSEDLVTDSETGVVLRDLSPDGLEAALDELDVLLAQGPALRRRCREAALTHLSLDRAVTAYAELYGAISRGEVR